LAAKGIPHPRLAVREYGAKNFIAVSANDFFGTVTQQAFGFLVSCNDATVAAGGESRVRGCVNHVSNICHCLLHVPTIVCTELPYFDTRPIP
jgi:hypothetical protein